MSVEFRVQPDRGCRKVSAVAQKDEISEILGRKKWQDLWVEHDDADHNQAERSSYEYIVKGRMDECSADERGG